jgi:ABC-type bacteriocin/lantibiotic exporter with double-glycine peptidase domain
MKQKSKSEYGFTWIFKRTKGTRPLLALYTFLILCNTVAAISMAYFLKLFVDVATGDLDASLLIIGAIAVMVIAAGGIFIMLSSVVSKLIYGKIERGLRTELMSTIFSRRMLDISKQHTGDLLTKLTVDVQAVSSCFPLIVEKMVGGIASAVIATAAMFFLNWKMALIMLVLTPVLMVVMGIVTPLSRKQAPLTRKMTKRTAA